MTKEEFTICAAFILGGFLSSLICFLLLRMFPEQDLIAHSVMQQKVESMDHEYKEIPKMDLGPGSQVMFRSITGDWCDQIEINPSGSVATKEIYLQVQNTKTKLWRNVDKVENGKPWRIMLREELF